MKLAIESEMSPGTRAHTFHDDTGADFCSWHLCASEQRQGLVGKDDWNPGDASEMQMKESRMERGSKGGEKDRENQRRVGTEAGKQEKSDSILISCKLSAI